MRSSPVRQRSTHPRGVTPALVLVAVFLLPACAAPTDDARNTGAPSPTVTAPTVTPSSTPLPTPTGTWTPAPTDAPTGPASAAPQPTRSATLTDTVTFETRVGVSLAAVEAVDVTAGTPGEVDGPAVRVTVDVTNDSGTPVDVGSAVVTLGADGDTLGIATTAGDPAPLAGTVPAGGTTRGTYVFMLDPARSREVTIHVNYAAGEPVAVFTGRTA